MVPNHPWPELRLLVAKGSGCLADDKIHTAKLNRPTVEFVQRLHTLAP